MDHDCEIAMLKLDSLSHQNCNPDMCERGKDVFDAAICSEWNWKSLGIQPKHHIILDGFAPALASYCIFLWLYMWQLFAAISLFPAVAGLDLGRCDFPRVDGRNLTDEAGLPGLPVLVYGLGVPKLPSLPLDEVVQVSNGRNEQGQRRYVNAKIADYLKNAERMRLEEDDRISLPTIFLSDLLTGVQRKLWHGLQLPQLMDGFTARPILSMGVKNSGEDFHNHEETWLWLAKGIKAWWISDAKHISNLRKFDPCALLSAQPKQPKLRFCVQHPGDVVFFGDHAHATCNLENFVLGIGAQGHIPRSAAPLLRASQSGQLARLEEAIQRKEADASVGRNALHAAAVWGHQKAAQLLLKAGAQMRADGEGLEPIHLAALHGHVSLVEFFSPFFQGSRSDLIHRAAMQGHVEVMKSMLKSSKFLLSSDAKAIHFAAKGGHVGAVDFLLQRRANLEEKSEPEGLSPLHFAASQGHTELVQHLMNLGSELVGRDSRGLLPIHLAVHADSARVVREMMLRNFPEDLGHFAAEGGRSRALRAILKKKPHVAQLVDKRGFLPLHMAAMAGHIETIQLLVDHKASPSAPDSAGFTPLHFAAKSGDRDGVQRLLELKADVAARSKDGNSPRDVAKRMGHNHLLKILQIESSKGNRGKGGRKAEL